jgi:DNA polymerase-1
MVRLDLDLPLPKPLEALGIQPQWPELISELEKCEFKSLLAEVRADAATATLAVTTATPKVQGELF